MSIRRLVLAALVAVALVLTQSASTAGSGASAPAAKVRTYYQNVDVPGYSVFCRYDPQLLIVDGKRGTGCFDSATDHFAIVDTKKDGRGVAVLWQLLNGDKRGICRNATTSKKRPAWPTCQFESTIPEHRRIRAWVSSCNVTDTRNCRKWSHYPPQENALKRVYKTTHPADA